MKTGKAQRSSGPKLDFSLVTLSPEEAGSQPGRPPGGTASSGWRGTFPQPGPRSPKNKAGTSPPRHSDSSASGEGAALQKWVA